MASESSTTAKVRAALAHTARLIASRAAPRPRDVRADAEPESFQLALDYQPSAAPGPRWGYGRPTHSLLHSTIAAHEQTYRAALEMLAGYADDLAKIEPVAHDPRDPSWSNGFLPGLDGVALYGFIRSRAPRRYLEVGSGNSTKFVARARHDGGLTTLITSIDPSPRAEVNELCDAVVRQPLETHGMERFAELEPNDILFFDGSHRTFTNSDATIFFLEVLPALPPGVLVGIHDIFLPDDYPPAWTDRYYSEQYLLAAYLLAGCPWLAPKLAAWYISAHTDLSTILNPLWVHPHLDNIHRHGGTFWLEIGRE